MTRLTALKRYDRAGDLECLGGVMETARCSQESLIREAQAGSHAAFSQLVRAHDEAVLRLAFRITGSHIDAQDIHQEVFLKVYKKIDRFRFECSFSTWVTRIVTNTCIDHLRKNRNRRETGTTSLNLEGEEVDLLNHISDQRQNHNPERELLRNELGASIFSALRRLTPRERIVFHLKHFQGMKLRTVSEILNTSEKSVKTSLFRATRKLRLLLSRHAGQPNYSADRCRDDRYVVFAGNLERRESV
jgi:RNA polymerase sigma-70 factor (ECF subfamily)